MLQIMTSTNNQQSIFGMNVVPLNGGGTQCLVILIVKAVWDISKLFMIRTPPKPALPFKHHALECY